MMKILKAIWHIFTNSILQVISIVILLALAAVKIANPDMTAWNQDVLLWGLLISAVIQIFEVIRSKWKEFKKETALKKKDKIIRQIFACRKFDWMTNEGKKFQSTLEEKNIQLAIFELIESEKFNAAAAWHTFFSDKKSEITTCFYLSGLFGDGDADRFFDAE